MNPLWFGAAPGRKAALLVPAGLLLDIVAGGHFGGLFTALALPANFALAFMNTVEFLLALATAGDHAAFAGAVVNHVAGTLAFVLSRPGPLLGGAVALAVLAYAGHAAWDKAAGVIGGDEDDR